MEAAQLRTVLAHGPPRYAHQGGRIGITNNVDWTEPASHSQADIDAAERSLEFHLGWFTDPIFGTGDYPASRKAVLRGIQ